MAFRRKFIDGLRFSFRDLEDGTGHIEVRLHNQIEGVFSNEEEAIKYIRLEILPEYQVGCGSVAPGRPRKRWMLEDNQLRST